MTKAERLKLLQARLAKMQLKKAELPGRITASHPSVVSPLAQMMLPPIRIDLNVKAQTDPSQEQRIANMTIPSPG